MTSPIVGLDHVQLAIPAGGEAAADRFYVDTLGLVARPKPAVLAARGGRWYAGGSAQIHLGVEQDFRAARKAHPALLVTDLDALVHRLDLAGHPFRWSDELPEVRRGFVDDPFGNRLELIQIES